MPAPPYLLHFDQIGEQDFGFIASTQQASNLPFAVKRVFWTYATPAGVIRGNHANKTTQEVLIAITGSITVTADSGQGSIEFVLDSPSVGLYIPALCWTNLHFSEGTVAVCLASTDFEESDYIRDYQDFRSIVAKASV
ncbi:sugar 3,4-ketoisomerase [Pontibacter vulgaris]|uniref:sugar 3,4-ketoisomerase n=1 Tax=Pontibacter vulgaris TaxID=2905679 RepID=UPI001FA76342|nr:FdtA/QdtA family cupin domain-containing protein [Pontibacter vulgaris]